MFGYVVANVDALSEFDRERYRSVYCGLCRALSKSFGQLGRLTLNYDMTFLIILLSAIDKTELAEEKTIRCVMHPLKPRQAFSNRHTQYAADMNLLLAYYQKMDDWEDDRKTGALFQAKLLGSKVEELFKKYPRQSKVIIEGLDDLSQMEKEGETNPDLPAAVFGDILGEVFSPENHPLANDLYLFGSKLGRFIYLMDAAVDLKKDLQREKYNPLVMIPTDRHGNMLTLLMADCMEAFSRLPVLRDRELMENILYSGVWSRYPAYNQGEKAE
ncbi:MAG: DUF5685 family protein [Bacillota bacterium]|nr:DUF5685 family protein [Bacillota bacterium]